MLGHFGQAKTEQPELQIRVVTAYSVGTHYKQLSEVYVFVEI